MLSQHDRHALAGIEQHFRDTDPEFALRLEHMTPHHPRQRRLPRRLIVPAGLALGMLLLALAIAAHNADLAAVALIVLVSGSTGLVLCAVSKLRRHP